MSFRPRIRTKNFSCDYLKSNQKNLKRFPIRSVVRLGSTTETSRIFGASRVPIVEINTVEAVENSRSKLLMKSCFAAAGVPQAEWYTYSPTNNVFLNRVDGAELRVAVADMPYPIVAKRIYGFKAKGMEKIDNAEQMSSFLSSRYNNGYYFEKFYNYAREYRIHCTKRGAFLKWRKLRRANSEVKWYFNSHNCNWVGENHEMFNAPVNMSRIEEACVAALNSTGLDIGALDVRVQGNGTINPGFIILEVNSAPSLGELGNKEYAAQIELLIQNKIHNGN